MKNFKTLDIDHKLIELVSNTKLEKVDDFFYILDQFTSFIAKNLQVDRVSVWRIGHNKSSIVLESLYLSKEGEFQRDLVINQEDYPEYFEGLFKREVIEATDAHNHEATNCFSESYLKLLEIESMIDTPIWHYGEMSGVLCLEYFDRKSWSKEEKDFLKSVSDLIGGIYEKRKSLEVLDDLRRQRIAIDEHNLVSRTDLKGKIVYCNKKFAEISGYQVRELIGQDHRIVNSGVHPKEFWAYVWESILSGKPWQGEVCNKSKSGELYWVETTIMPLKDSDGTINEFISIRTDITQNKLNETRLKEANAQSKILNELLSVGQTKTSLNEKLEAGLKSILSIGWLDILFKGGVFLEENGILKLTISNNLGEKIEGLCSEVKLGQCLCGRAFESKKTVFASCVDERHEVQFDGMKAHGHYNVPILDRGEVIGVIVLYLPHGHQRDDNEIEFLESCADVLSKIIISDRHEQSVVANRDRAMLAERTKSEFLANMSHEIRTPMNGVLGMTQLLLDTELSDEQKDLLSVIKSCGDNLLTILNDILDISKIDAGKLELEKINFNLKESISETVKLLSFKAQEKHVELIEHYDKDLPVWFHGDITRVRQIIVNYISNAIKFTDSGSVTVKVEHLGTSGKTVELKISVIDTGMGIPKNSQAKLFEAFSQADSSITRQFGGTGLGLTICSQLTKLMGGKVSVSSEVGKGSTFSSTLKLDIGSEAKIRLVSDCDDSIDNLSKIYDHTILLVEDNKINQKFAIKMLKKLGYDCDVASNGAEALMMVKDKDYSIVFMDVQMPVMDGISASKEISKEFGADAPPIVAMTANVFSDDRRKCVQAGMIDFVPKPVKKEELIRVLKKFSSNKKASA